MEISDFKAEILYHYTDEDLQVTVDRDPTPRSTLNGLLYGSIYYVILSLLNAIEEEDKERFSKMVSMAECQTYLGMGQSKGLPGIYHRRKGVPNRQAFDDYVGIATASYFLGAPFARHIVIRGDEFRWTFDNTDPYRKAPLPFDWARHDRFPGQVAFYCAAANDPVPFCRKLGFSGALRNSIPSRRGNSTHVMLDWLKIQVARKIDLCPVAVDMWITGFKETYGDTRELFAEHFGKGHPFAQIAV